MWQLFPDSFPHCSNTKKMDFQPKKRLWRESHAFYKTNIAVARMGRPVAHARCSHSNLVDNKNLAISFSCKFKLNIKNVTDNKRIKKTTY